MRKVLDGSVNYTLSFELKFEAATFLQGQSYNY